MLRLSRHPQHGDFREPAPYQKDVYCEWAPNEKVATEVAYGAAVAGSRSICTMKMVGLNVAADPLFTAGYMGVGGGFVVVTADDPSCHSSQNEQDNRHYARAAKIAMVEPSDAQECKDFVALACELSEEFDTPVLYRTTTRVCHSKGLVQWGSAGSMTAPPLPAQRPQVRLHPRPRLRQPPAGGGAAAAAGGVRLHPCAGKRPEQEGDGRRKGGCHHGLRGL